MMCFPKSLATLAMLLTLSACAADTTNYPSLARRDAEKSTNAASPAPAPAAMPIGAELLARLTVMVDQARTAHEAFVSRTEKAERTVAASAGIGSDSWGTATVALADLESARSDAMIALADLDELYAQARVAGVDAAAITKARDQVIALVGEEDRVLATLRSRMAR
jgi:hypothetical protein